MNKISLNISGNVILDSKYEFIDGWVILSNTDNGESTGIVLININGPKGVYEIDSKRIKNILNKNNASNLVLSITCLDTKHTYTIKKELTIPNSKIDNLILDFVLTIDNITKDGVCQ